MTTAVQPDFRAVVELARAAPSIHNTQPWQFVVEDGALVLMRDVARQLPSIDPDGRQQTISCGAALWLARLALRVQGFDAQVELGQVEPVLARVRAAAGDPVTPLELALEHAARSRHTQRAPFEPRDVAPEVLDALRAAAEAEHAWVHLLSADEQVALAVLLGRAEDAELADPAYLDELRSWTGRPEGATDGIPEAAAPTTRDRASRVRLRDFTPEAAGTAPGPGTDVPPPVERPAVVVIGTPGDSSADWLTAGQAMVALLVRAFVDGVQASPLAQAVDQEWTRRRLAAELGAVGVPQMLLRAGYARPGAPTARRPVEEILR
ncbi:MAG: hypothetical protein QOE01_1178 [Actinomycetota bacterium]|nr:hypothetical protein [Actinomycetota bacterium]